MMNSEEGKCPFPHDQLPKENNPNQGETIAGENKEARAETTGRNFAGTSGK